MKCNIIEGGHIIEQLEELEERADLTFKGSE